MTAKTRRFAGWISCSGAILTVAAVAYSTRLPAREPGSQDVPCEGCETYEKQLIVWTGDPEVDQATFDRINSEGQRIQEGYKAAARAKHLQKAQEWNGTRIGLGPKIAAPQLAVAESFCRALAADLPAPAEREAAFAWCLAPGSEYTAIGWEGFVDSVVEVDGAWEVVVQVRPALWHPQHYVVMSRQHSVETWRVADDLGLTFVGAAPTDPNRQGAKMVRRFR